MRFNFRSGVPALAAAIAGMILLSADGIAQTLTRGSPAQWKAACAASPRSCHVTKAEGQVRVYGVCFASRCFVVTCSEADDGGSCQRAIAPGVRPRPKQLQWQAAELL